MTLLLALLVLPSAQAKKPRKEAPPPDVTAPAPAPAPAPTPPPGAEPAWADVPPDAWLPASGPVRGRMGAVPVEMPGVALSFHVAPPGDPELVTTATLYLEQKFFEAEGDQLGGNQLWLGLPTSLGVGTYRSETPSRPPFAQLSTAPDGSDARNWQSSQVVWVLEITSWDVTMPDAPPADEIVIGTASGRVAAHLRDSWGGPDTGFVAGTFTGIEVRASAAGW